MSIIKTPNQQKKEIREQLDILIRSKSIERPHFRMYRNANWYHCIAQNETARRYLFGKMASIIPYDIFHPTRAYRPVSTRHEGPMKGTVMTCFMDTNMVVHLKTERCQIEYPHRIEECQEFDHVNTVNPEY